MVDIENVMKLGDSIELFGFNATDSKSMVILKKMIGNYTRGFTDKSTTFEKLILSLDMKDNSDFELKGEAFDNGQSHVSSIQGNNLFVGVGDVLKGLESSLIK